MVANYSCRRHGHRKRQTWNPDPVKAMDNKFPAQQHEWFPMGMGVTLAKPQLLRCLIKRKDLLKVVNTSSNLTAFFKSQVQSLLFLAVHFPQTFLEICYLSESTDCKMAEASYQKWGYSVTIFVIYSRKRRWKGIILIPLANTVSIRLTILHIFSYI